MTSLGCKIMRDLRPDPTLAGDKNFEGLYLDAESRKRIHWHLDSFEPFSLLGGQLWAAAYSLTYTKFATTC